MFDKMFNRTNVLYIAEAGLEYLITILISGAYLAKLTTSLGFSDSLTAILSSFVALGYGFQLLSMVFFKSGKRVKWKVCIMHIVNQLFFMSTYLVPFFNFDKTLKTGLFMLFLIGGYFISNIIFAPKTGLYMRQVADHQRGIFTSVKEAVSLISGFLFQLVMGLFIDHFEAKGEIRTAFTLCAITIFVLMVTHTLTIVFAKEEAPVESKIKPTPTIERFKGVLTDKTIVKVIMTSVFWTISNHIIVSFFGTYQVNELGFSMKFITVISVLNAFSRVPCSFVFGKYADKYSFAKMLKICYGIAAFSFLIVAFAVPKNGFIVYPIYSILYSAAMGGINSGEINLIFDYVAPEKRNDALAVKQTIYGICGFLTTLAMTPAFNYIQNFQRSNGKIFGITIYAQQFLSIVACIATVLLIFYLDRQVLKKIKPRRIEIPDGIEG